CNIDPIAVDTLALDNDIAQVDANAKLHAAVGRKFGVSGAELMLDGDGTLHSLDHTGKLRQQVIAWGVHDAPPVLLDESGHQLAVRRDGTHCRCLILTHEAAIPLDISAEDCRKPAFHAHTLPALMVACLTDPEVGLTAERVEAWRNNWNEALLCSCNAYSSYSRSQPS